MSGGPFESRRPSVKCYVQLVEQFVDGAEEGRRHLAVQWHVLSALRLGYVAVSAADVGGVVRFSDWV